MCDRDLNEADSFGGVVLRRTGEGLSVLMIRNGRGWSFPKGHMEQGETEAETAVREIMEETNISVRLDCGFRMSVPSAREGENRNVTFFLASYEGGCVCPLPEEAAEAAWVPLNEASGLIGYMPDRDVLLAAVEYIKCNPGCIADIP